LLLLVVAVVVLTVQVVVEQVELDKVHHFQ
jgi:hypothetical protein